MSGIFGGCRPVTIESLNKSGQLWLLKTLALVGVFLIFIIVFMEVKSSRELDLARAFLPKSGETAIRHYFQALNWYAPWGSSQTAADELLALGIKYKNEGQKELAYSAFLRLRAAIYAARSFYLPRRDILSVANDFLANYLADKKISLGAQGTNKQDLYSYYLGLYSAEVNFSEFFAFIVVLSFLGWIYFFIKFIFSFFKDNEFLPLKQKIIKSKIFISMFIVCYITWIFSMKMA
jgi:hypothetical protein